MPSGLFLHPNVPPQLGVLGLSPLPLALHPVCTQILLPTLLFLKGRTKMPHISDSGQPYEPAPYPL